MSQVLQSFEDWIRENRPDGWQLETVLSIDEQATDEVVIESSPEHASTEIPSGEINLTLDQWKEVKGIGNVAIHETLEKFLVFQILGIVDDF